MIFFSIMMKKKWLLLKNIPMSRLDYKNPGVSIKFEVGSWLKKNNRLYEQGAVRPINLGRSGGMLPQKILKSGGFEMPFPAF